MSIDLRTLVLDANYVPISIFPLHTISVTAAVTRVFNGTCQVVIEYDRKILTQRQGLKWPSVVARIGQRSSLKNRVKLSAETIYYRDRGKCQYCEKHLTLGQTTLDHVLPESKGGPFSWENLVAACTSCNELKAAHMPTGKWTPKQWPFKPTYYQLLESRKKFPIVIGDPQWLQFLGEWDADVLVT